MLGCDGIVMKICGKSTKRRKFSRNFGWIICKIWAVKFYRDLDQIFEEIFGKICKISVKFSKMNVAKILIKYLRDFR